MLQFIWVSTVFIKLLVQVFPVTNKVVPGADRVNKLGMTHIPYSWFSAAERNGSVGSALHCYTSRSKGC